MAKQLVNGAVQEAKGLCKSHKWHIFTFMKIEENLSNLKVRITQQLLGIEDVDVLVEVQAILDGADRGDWWDDLTPEEQAGLDEADQQLDRGESFTNEEVKAKVKEWIKR